MKKLLLLPLLVAGLALSAASCNVVDQQAADNTVMETPKEPNTVLLSDYKFDPPVLKVKKGTTVTWKNMDQANHTVTGDNGGPNSDYFGNAATYTYTFDAVGNFAYHCEPHPFMKGTVEVTE